MCLQPSKDKECNHKLGAWVLVTAINACKNKINLSFTCYIFSPNLILTIASVVLALAACLLGIVLISDSNGAAAILLPIAIFSGIIIGAFSVAWFIVGNVWTFKSSTNRCDKTLFRAAFWFIMSVYITAGSSLAIAAVMLGIWLIGYGGTPCLHA